MHYIFASIFQVSLLLILAPLGEAFAHGFDNTESIALIVGTKKACDEAIPNFSATIDKPFSEAIKRAPAAFKQAEAQENYNKLVKDFYKSALALPRFDLEKQCNELVASLTYEKSDSGTEGRLLGKWFTEPRYKAMTAIASQHRFIFRMASRCAQILGDKSFAKSIVQDWNSRNGRYHSASQKFSIQLSVTGEIERDKERRDRINDLDKQAQRKAEESAQAAIAALIGDDSIDKTHVCLKFSKDVKDGVFDITNATPNFRDIEDLVHNFKW